MPLKHMLLNLRPLELEEDQMRLTYLRASCLILFYSRSGVLIVQALRQYRYGCLIWCRYLLKLFGARWEDGILALEAGTPLSELCITSLRPHLSFVSTFVDAILQGLGLAYWPGY